MRTMGLRLASVDPTYLDLAFAAAMLIELELVGATIAGISREHQIVTAVACLLLVIPLLLRRRSPGVALVAVGLVAAVQTLLGGALLSTGISDEVGPFIVIIALSYSAGAWLDFRSSLVAFGVALVLVEASQFLPGGGSIPSGMSEIASTAFYAALVVIPPWLVGRFDVAANRQDQVGELEQPRLLLLDHFARASFHLRPGAPHEFETYAYSSDVAHRSIADRLRVLSAIQPRPVQGLTQMWLRRCAR